MPPNQNGSTNWHAYFVPTFQNKSFDKTRKPRTTELLRVLLIQGSSKHAKRKLNGSSIPRTSPYLLIKLGLPVSMQLQLKPCFQRHPPGAKCKIFFQNLMLLERWMPTFFVFFSSAVAHLRRHSRSASQPAQWNITS